MAGQAVDALDVAVKALARRELSAVELLERIARAGFSPDEATKAVDKLRDAGYQSDERAAQERARVLAERGLGNGAIRADLRRRGLSVDVEPVIAELPPEPERAQALAERIGPGRRLVQTLQRKGYSEETIVAVAGADVAEAP